jgi:hypothetical protein
MHQNLLPRVGDDYPSYSTVTNWIKKLERGEEIHQRASRSEYSPDDRLPFLVATALEE